MDGPGIRTTVFTMGCRYRCPWCCNPENLTHEIKTGKNNITYGSMMDIDEVIDIINKDKKYYEDNGGVTFSGGEFLLNVLEYIDILKKLKELNINICVETSLNAPLENLKLAIDYVDLFIIDFKIIDNKLSNDVLKYTSESFVTNFKFLSNNTNIKYIARIPLAKEIITKNNLKEIKDLMKLHKPYKIEIFKIHNLAKSKYDNLDMELLYDFKVSNDEVKNVINSFNDLCVQIKELKP